MWKAIRSYVWWTHPRGSLQYDVMVTLILAFIFISPHYINYRDKPATPATLGSYLIPVDHSSTDTPPIDRAALRRALPPHTGSIEIDHYEPLQDPGGNIAAYRVWIKR